MNRVVGGITIRAVKYNPSVHRRRSIRLPGYDYAQTGAYFVTICVEDRECLLGRISQCEMTLTPFGRCVERAWYELGNHNPQVQLDSFVVMPNHVHGIIVIQNEEVARLTNSGGSCSKEKTLGRLVGSFKTMSTKTVNILRGTPGAQLWQRNYYERIVRDEEELGRIREYMHNNPAKWLEDPNFVVVPS